MPPRLPTPQQRADVDEALGKLVHALQEHPAWGNPPNINPTLYFVWDFVSRSKYMLSEFENIQAGKPVEHPEQFKGGVGKGDPAALGVFQDACSRTMMLDLLVNDTTGKTAMMTGNKGPAVDFGQKVKDAVKELGEACPTEHLMAGLMA